jgi:hypothetical protein
MCRGLVNESATLPVFCYPEASHTPFATMRSDTPTRDTGQYVRPYGMKGRSWEP